MHTQLSDVFGILQVPSLYLTESVHLFVHLFLSFFLICPAATIQKQDFLRCVIYFSQCERAVPQSCLGPVSQHLESNKRRSTVWPERPAGLW